MAVAVPFDTPEGQRVFSSGFQIESTPLDSFVRSSLPIKGSAAYVVDGGGTVVTSSRKGISGESLKDAFPDLHDTRLTSSGDLKLDGEKLHYVSAPVDGTKWRVIATVPTTTLYGPLRSVTILQAILALVLVLLVAVVALLVMRLIRAEQRLEMKVVELEAANRALDAFSHTLVHDLRNPLTAIGGFAYTLDVVLTDADERVREMTGHIASSAQRMHGLIEDVLALATVTRAADRIPVDPAEVLAQAATDMPLVDLELGWMPPSIDANRSSLYRAFQNLLENALNYASEPGGRAQVHVSADETPWHWRFFVQDHGPGVTDSDRARIFQAFERGVDAQSGTGTGLGLSIVAACAEAHGGSVRVDNTADGACFVIEIGKPARSRSRSGATPLQS